MRTSDADTIGAVLFDLDGTLVDTAADLVRALYAVCDQRAVERPAFENARREVANGANGLLALAFGDALDAEQHAQARGEFLTHYAGHIADESRLYQGLEYLLAALEASDIAWGVVTNKPEHLGRALLRELRVYDRLHCLVGGDTLPRAKPDPAPLFYAAGLLNVHPERCIYVGDHERDIRAAHDAGMRSVAAAYGYLAEAEDAGDWGAEAVACAPTELIDALRATGLRLAAPEARSR